jgi:hypothetical protein
MKDEDIIMYGTLQTQFMSPRKEKEPGIYFDFPKFGRIKLCNTRKTKPQKKTNPMKSVEL